MQIDNFSLANWWGVEQRNQPQYISIKKPRSISRRGGGVVLRRRSQKSCRGGAVKNFLDFACDTATPWPPFLLFLPDPRPNEKNPNGPLSTCTGRMRRQKVSLQIVQSSSTALISIIPIFVSGIQHRLTCEAR